LAKKRRRSGQGQKLAGGSPARAPSHKKSPGTNRTSYWGTCRRTKGDFKRTTAFRGMYRIIRPIANKSGFHLGTRSNLAKDEEGRGEEEELGNIKQGKSKSLDLMPSWFLGGRRGRGRKRHTATITSSPELLRIREGQENGEKKSLSENLERNGDR